MKRVVYLALLLVFSCKKVSYNCSYVIAPMVQRQEHGAEVRRDSVVCYQLDGDTSSWKVSSFEDAAAGLFTNAATGQRRSYDQMAVPDADTLLALSIRSEWCLVLVCDLADSIYGWRNVQIGSNMPSMRVLIKFRPWRQTASYDDLKWRMVRPREE